LLPSVKATIRMYQKLFSLRTYRRRVAVSLLAFLGATVTLTQLAVWISGASSGIALALPLAILAPIGIVFAVRISLPKADMTFRHDSASAPLRVLLGDIFATNNAVVVITMNRHFDTADPWVSASSLVAQFVQRYYTDNPDELRNAILKELALEEESEQPLGRIVRIATGNNTYLLLAVAGRHEQTRSSVAVDEVWTSLSRLWQYARKNNISSLRLPVVGSGFARAQVGRVPLILLLLTSYLTTAMEMPTCGLEVVLSRDDADPDLLELVKAYCDILGYKTIDQKVLDERYLTLGAR
jgi:antiphage defense system Thoeris ThsA-like protein